MHVIMRVVRVPNLYFGSVYNTVGEPDYHVRGWIKKWEKDWNSFTVTWRSCHQTFLRIMTWERASKEDESRSFGPIGVCLSSKTPSCLETVTRERFIFSSFDIVIIDHWRPHQHRPNDIYGILKEVLRRREDDHRWHGWTWGRIIGDKHICSNPSTSSHRQLFILIIVF